MPTKITELSVLYLAEIASKHIASKAKMDFVKLSISNSEDLDFLEDNWRHTNELLPFIVPAAYFLKALVEAQHKTESPEHFSAMLSTEEFHNIQNEIDQAEKELVPGNPLYIVL